MPTAQEMVDAYVAAEIAVLKNQSYAIGTRSYTRANLEEIRAGRSEWEIKARIEAARQRGGSSLYSVADFR